MCVRVEDAVKNCKLLLTFGSSFFLYPYSLGCFANCITVLLIVNLQSNERYKDRIMGRDVKTAGAAETGKIFQSRWDSVIDDLIRATPAPLKRRLFEGCVRLAGILLIFIDLIFLLFVSPRKTYV